MPKQQSCVLNSFYICSPIGSMVIKSCSLGLHMTSQSDSIEDSNFDNIAGKCPSVKHDMDPKDLEVTYPIINECVNWLSMYFTDPRLVSKQKIPKLCPRLITDTFQSRVWVMLAENVGPGKTISYKQLAEMASNPGAVRAAGSAMGANPFQIIIPCHRVLPSSGRLGKYAFGKKNKVKAWLLRHEGVSVLI